MSKDHGVLTVVSASHTSFCAALPVVLTTTSHGTLQAKGWGKYILWMYGVLVCE